jgi:putative DNA primase/helicase
MRPTERVLEVVRGGPHEERFNLTDLGNAERFVAQHGDDVRYCYQWRKWLVWAGVRWERDETGKVERLAKETVRSIYEEAAAAESEARRKELAKHATRSEAEARIRAMLELAKSEVPVSPEELDRDPWKLNTLNGTVDLVGSGELMDHKREDLITKVAPVEYDPEASSEVWERCLKTITGGDAALARFLQRAAGYSLTGDVSEEVLFFVHGPAASGKSTFIEALKSALGDYATTADFEAFLARRDVGGARNDIARLAGARLVASIEVDEGKRLAEGLIKMLTGGDVVTARHLYKEAFEFLPAFKLWLAANHAPRIRDDDEAMWRRILRVPFEHIIPKEARDPAVKRALRNPQRTGAAILAWAVQGCLAWQREGLGVPPAVETATRELREEMDPLKDFFEDCCILKPEAWVLTADLRQAYETWARERGEAFVLRGRQFTDRLKARSLVPERRHAGRGWQGIGLFTTTPPPPNRAKRDVSDTGQNPSKPQENRATVTLRDGENSNSKENLAREGELPKLPSRSVTRHAEEAAGDYNRLVEERMAELEPCIHDVVGGCHLCRPEEGSAP